MAWLVSACGSVAPDRFYTLAGMMPNGTSQASTSQVAPAGFYIELMPVDVPPQVSRAQLVVATGPAQVELLEHERWSAPLSDEVGRSLSDNLTRLLGAINVYRTPYPATSPVFRISVNLQRFESAPGRHAGMDATWSVRLLPDGEPVTCRSSIDEPVAAAGYDALVAGHRRALLRLSADIAGVVRTLAQHRAATTAADQRVRVGTGTGMGSSAPMPALWCPAAG
jgi:uncharacterized lipoprotein YmbA